MSDPDFRGWAIFCDDIRVEVGGKISFIGVYENQMFLHGEFPFTLPKFAIAVRYLERAEAMTEEAVVRVFAPGEKEDDALILEGVLPAQEARNAPVPPDWDPNETRYLGFGANIILAPFVIQRTGTIRVRVFCGEEIIKIGALRIEQAKTESSLQSLPMLS